LAFHGHSPLSYGPLVRASRAIRRNIISTEAVEDIPRKHHLDEAVEAIPKKRHLEKRHLDRSDGQSYRPLRSGETPVFCPRLPAVQAKVCAWLVQQQFSRPFAITPKPHAIAVAPGVGPGFSPGIYAPWEKNGA
jgi:hypothetical protein